MKKVVILIVLVFITLFTYSVSAQAQQKYAAKELQQLFEIMENKNLSIAQVVEIIKKNNAVVSQKATNADEIKLTVDYTKIVEQSIAAGKYDWKNSDITAKNFPISLEMIGKKVEVSAKLFHFNRGISSDDAISEMDKDGYRPATSMELLALGYQYPELQRQFPIVALGSVWHDADLSRCMSCLLVGGSGRGLDLGWFGSGWDARYRFLGVRK